MSKPVCYMGIYNEHDIRDMHTVVVRYVTDFKSNPDRVIPLYEHPPVPTTERRVPDNDLTCPKCQHENNVATVICSCCGETYTLENAAPAKDQP